VAGGPSQLVRFDTEVGVAAGFRNLPEISSLGGLSDDAAAMAQTSAGSGGGG
jgi:hypothetical protein